MTTTVATAASNRRDGDCATVRQSPARPRGRRRREDERVAELTGSRIAVGRELGQRARERGIEVSRNARTNVRTLDGASASTLAITDLNGLARERRVAGQQLVEHAGQREDVAPAVHIGRAGRLLRAHVARRA